MTPWQPRRAAAPALVLAAVSLAACVATPREPMDEARRAAHKARLERMAAVKDALARQWAAILRLERLADEAAAEDPARALELYREALGLVPRPTRHDLRIRRKVIRLVAAMPAPPEVPKPARTHLARARKYLEDSEYDPLFFRREFYPAIQELEQALLWAPWWSDAYFNLGIIQDHTEDFAEAVENLELYLLAAPEAEDRGKVETRLEGIKLKRREAARRRRGFRP